MLLKKILEKIEYEQLYGVADKDITGISIDSRNISRGSLFIAIKGFTGDGHDFAAEAVTRGAGAILATRRLELPDGITQVILEDTRKALPVVSSNFFGHPGKDLVIAGITGTNGKTTTCYLVNSILKTAGIRSSMITTVESFIRDKMIEFERTTPESHDLNRFFRESVEKSVQTVCMEISSHSIDLHRVDNINFDYFTFTNLSQDHLDYHGSMENYFGVKKRLFLKKYREVFGGKKAVINMDNPYGIKLIRETDLDVISYSTVRGSSDVWAADINSSVSGISMRIENKKGAGFEINSPLCGNFNVYNILAAVALALDMNIDISHISKGISMLGGVPGRFEKIHTGSGTTVVVDYAHTPDGLENVLKTAREIISPNGRLISVFGCGGDRDRKKRKIMGEISGKLADFTIVTSDNPRSESPEIIIGMIEKGLTGPGKNKYIKVTDRKEAISGALELAGEKDLVLIAGKGHENYQEFKDTRIPFCDQEIVRKWYGKE